MARVRMVTRTVTTQEVTALCLNIVTAEPENQTFSVPVNIKGEDSILKFIRKVYDTDTTKIVSITHIRNEEHLYGMPEADFIKTAKIIDKNNDEVENVTADVKE